MDKNTQKQIENCLFGGAAGDALGYPVEFIPYESIINRFGKNGITKLQLHNGRAMISDDTQMTLFSAAAIINYLTDQRLKGETEPLSVYVYRAYLDWLNTQGRSGNTGKHCWLADCEGLYELRAPGLTCLGSLESGRMGTPDKPLNNRKGCGGIMRTAPFGLVEGFSAERAFDEGCKAAAVTHGHELGYLPAGVLSYLVHKLVFDRETLSDAVYLCINYLDSLSDKYYHTGELVHYMNEAMRLSVNSDPDIKNIRALEAMGVGGGWTGDTALYISLYCALRHQNDLRQALIAAVNHSGDSDSTGAIVGNLVGAIENTSNDDYKQNIELSGIIYEIAADLSAGCPAEPDMAWLEKYQYHNKPERL